jgi:hypothetical protein
MKYMDLIDAVKKPSVCVIAYVPESEIIQAST